MEGQNCKRVRRWLRQQDPDDSVALPPLDISDHVADCPVCRGALTTLMATLLHSSPEADAVSACVNPQDMAAYIDIERNEGALAAFQRYPHVWWHLWTCRECAETYHLTGMLLDAEEAGALMPLPFLQPEPPVQLRLPNPLHLGRAFITQVFGHQLLLGPAWGGDNEEFVLSEEDSAEYHVCLSVQQHNSTCELILTVKPPIPGQAVVSIGSAVFRASFDTIGKAVFDTIPTDLLTTADGPDLTITFE